MRKFGPIPDRKGKVRRQPPPTSRLLHFGAGTSHGKRWETRQGNNTPNFQTSSFQQNRYNFLLINYEKMHKKKILLLIQGIFSHKCLVRCVQRMLAQLLCGLGAPLPSTLAGDLGCHSHSPQPGSSRSHFHAAQRWKCHEHLEASMGSPGVSGVAEAPLGAEGVTCTSYAQQG